MRRIICIFAAYIVFAMRKFIYNYPEWPNFIWDTEGMSLLCGNVRNLQGKLIGRMESLGFDLKNQANLETLTSDVVKTSEIEGYILNPDEVRSSISRRLGMEISGLVESDRYIDGVVDMTLDATRNYNKLLSKERLLDWHCALFPTGRSGMYKIVTGNWRDDSSGPMQVVSGAVGKEKVHFQAPEATVLDKEMQIFIEWFNKKSNVDLIIKAGIAHLWFVTLHPFEDGNGRIARALTDMILSKSDDVSQRFYSMSTQIRTQRNEYYTFLEKTQRGGLDITNWLKWFLNCLKNSIMESENTLKKIIDKHVFLNKQIDIALNGRQKAMINKLLDDFYGNLTTSKWAKITKCSSDTALRDIQDLVKKGLLRKAEEAGRSTNYELVK